jgi:flagellar basal body-associated protein FliL
MITIKATQFRPLILFLSQHFLSDKIEENEIEESSDNYERQQKITILIMILIYLSTATGLTPVGSSTVHIKKKHTHTQKNNMEPNTQNRTYIIIRINKHKNKIT